MTQAQLHLALRRRKERALHRVVVEAEPKGQGGAAGKVEEEAKAAEAARRVPTDRESMAGRKTAARATTATAEPAGFSLVRREWEILVRRALNGPQPPVALTVRAVAAVLLWDQEIMPAVRQEITGPAAAAAREIQEQAALGLPASSSLRMRRFLRLSWF